MIKVLLLLFFVTVASGIIPKGYVLDVIPTCTDGNSPASLKIVSDLNVLVRSHCLNPNEPANVQIDENSQSVTIPLNYDTGPKGQCVFKTAVANSTVYTMKVELFWGEPDTSTHYVQANREVYNIVCSTGLNKEANSSKHKGFIPFAAEQISTFTGTEIEDTLTIKIVDIMNKEITGKIPIGKKVRLLAETNGSGYGITAVDCDAVDGSNRTYSLLRGGCGDGVVFAAKAGFVSEYDKAFSPYFGFFKFPDGGPIHFKCTFVKCDGNCTTTKGLDSSSCIAPRKRRSADDTELTIIEPRLIASSSPVNYMYQGNGDVRLVFSSRPHTPGHWTLTRRDSKFLVTLVIILTCCDIVALVMTVHVCVNLRKKLRLFKELSEQS